MSAIMGPVVLRTNPNPNQQRYGLFNAANGPLDLETHARGGGYKYTTPLCSLPGGYAVACIDSLATKTFTDGPSTTTGTPFVVLSTLTCGALGYSPAEWEAMAVEKLQAGEQAIVESVFSSGTFGEAPSLSNNTPNATSAGTATSTAGALGTLESWLYARYGPTGIIHIPISDAERVYTSDYLTRDGNVWRTKMGTAVSFGNYANTGPTGSAPGAGHSFWYITGQMSIWRSPDIFVSPYEANLNKTDNQIRIVAEREYVLAYDCYVAYVDYTLVA